MRLRQVFAGIGLVALATSGVVAFGGTPAGANPAPGYKADFEMSPDGPVVSKTVNGTMLGASRIETPDECRNHPVFNNLCDAWRLKLNLSKAPGAQNFVVIFLEFEATRRPDFAIPLLNTPDQTLPDLDLMVYRTPTISLASATVGGQDFNIPERVAFTANQAEYDIVVKNDAGVAQSYTLRMFMTDEIFDTQQELLDAVKKKVDESAPVTPIDESPFISPPDDYTPPPVSSELAPLAPITPTVDARISGIGLSPTQQFDFGALPDFAPRTQRAVSIGKKPSSASLVLALLVVPLLAGAGGALWLRRRRQALI